MPDLTNAIEGFQTLPRKREKAERIAREDFPNLPTWLKTWTREEVETYLDGLDWTNPVVIEEFAKRVGEVIILYRDLLKMLHE